MRISRLYTSGKEIWQSLCYWRIERKKSKNEKWQTALLKIYKWGYYARKFFDHYINSKRVGSP